MFELLVRNAPEYIKFLNDVLINEMEWNDDAKIKSKHVPMKASLEVGKSWDKLTQLHNNATLEEIINVFPTFKGST